jgi:cytochrome c peroxidase
VWYGYCVQRKILLLVTGIAVGLTCLYGENEPPAGSTPVPFKTPKGFPKPPLPVDNALSKERIALGDTLFHDTILSIDGTVSCAACHVIEFAFSDDVDLSRGFEGRLGKRNSMPLFNLAWKDRFFWDGRAKTLREQVLEPIQDHLEMAANLDRVIYRLNQRKSYRQDFKKAYGPGPITKEKLGLALENFLLTIVSHDSKYDRVVAQKATPTKHEKRGRFLFFTPHKKGGAGCFECHGGPHFSDFEFRNNGLSLVDDLNDFGVFKVTGKEKDKLKFVTPSLRNIAITEPYMHDGRLPKLEDVVKHYNSPLYKSPTLDPKLKAEGLGLSKEDQAALVAFLKTLTDPKFKL